MTDPTPRDETSPSGPPTCYRHPDRETHIRCVRCERSICPDCMVSASVGFQCPECVREGNKDRRQWRTTFGGRANDDPGLVSKAIIAASVVMYVGQMLAGPALERSLWLVGVGFDVTGVQGVAAGEWYRLLTAAFLHGGLLHLALNMYALYLFGPRLEAVFGRLRFIALYLLAALSGSAASYAFSEPARPSVGASGAIFGIFAAYIVVSRRLGQNASQLYVLLALNVVFGFVVANIDWRAHFGGFVGGAVVATAFAYAPPARRALLQAAGCVAVLLAALALVVWRTSDITGAGPTRVASCAVSAPLDAVQSYPTCLEG